MEALVEIAAWLRQAGYTFTSVTPDSHRRALGRLGPAEDPLRDLFGWSRPVAKERIPDDLALLLTASGLAEERQAGLRSRVRFSTLDKCLFAHSAFPTDDEDSVFFGPDTYRFVNYVRRRLRNKGRLLDIGCGTGAGGISLANRVREIHLSDINPTALKFSEANSKINSVEARIFKSDILNSAAENYDSYIANPPFMIDSQSRSYRHGGGEWGCELTLRIYDSVCARLKPGNELCLYSAAPFVEGVDILKSRLSERGRPFDYEEIDPDIFSTELHAPGYERVERIAAVGIYVSAPER